MISLPFAGGMSWQQDAALPAYSSGGADACECRLPGSVWCCGSAQPAHVAVQDCSARSTQRGSALLQHLMWAWMRTVTVHRLYHTVQQDVLALLLFTVPITVTALKAHPSRSCCQWNMSTHLTKPKQDVKALQWNSCMTDCKLMTPCQYHVYVKEIEYRAWPRTVSTSCGQMLMVWYCSVRLSVHALNASCVWTSAAHLLNSILVPDDRKLAYCFIPAVCFGRTAEAQADFFRILHQKNINITQLHKYNTKVTDAGCKSWVHSCQRLAVNCALEETERQPWCVCLGYYNHATPGSEACGQFLLVTSEPRAVLLACEPSRFALHKNVNSWDWDSDSSCL